MNSVAYYITAHGYGHGTRSCDILNALHAARPDLPIIVKTDLPPDFMASRLSPGIEHRCGAFDLGLIQKDSIQVDLDASIETIAKLYAREEELTTQEMEFMRNEKVGVVVADIPAIPLAAAQRAGLPNIGTSNFGWDWIYSEFVKHDPRWSIYIEKFRSVYARTDLLMRQPFAESMSAFPNQIDLPLLASPGTNRRAEMARATGADPDRKWILLSFTTLNLDFQALENLAKLRHCELFSVEPLAWPGSVVRSISRSSFSFADALTSVDAVVTKPGFGIVSECIANDKPIIYADRENFLEYPILVENIERYCRHAFIPAEKLYAGDLGEALKEAEQCPPASEQMPRGGAAIAAKHILQLMR